MGLWEDDRLKGGCVLGGECDDAWCGCCCCMGSGAVSSVCRSRWSGVAWRLIFLVWELWGRCVVIVRRIVSGGLKVWDCLCITGEGDYGGSAVQLSCFAQRWFLLQLSRRVWLTVRLWSLFVEGNGERKWQKLWRGESELGTGRVRTCEVLNSSCRMHIVCCAICNVRMALWYWLPVNTSVLCLLPSLCLCIQVEN